MKQNREARTLTRAEMDVMNILWSSGRGMTTHHILEQYPEPKPAYSTVATFMKILTTKGFVSHRKRENGGKTFYYYPLVTREEYTRQVMREVKDSFFGGSGSSLVRFFVREDNISVEEIRELLEMIDKDRRPC